MEPKTSPLSEGGSSAWNWPPLLNWPWKIRLTSLFSRPIRPRSNSSWGKKLGNFSRTSARRMASTFTPQLEYNKFNLTTVSQSQYSWTANKFPLMFSSWPQVLGQPLTLLLNLLTKKITELRLTSIYKLSIRMSMPQEILPAILTGIPARVPESNTSMKPFIKAQSQEWTWLERNSQWTMFLSSGPGNSTTPWFSAELHKAGMTSTSQAASNKWSSLLTTLTRKTTKS